MNSVVVIDSGVANIGSVVAALERLQAKVTVSRDWEQIRHAPRVLLPGVGSAAAAMRELDKLQLTALLPTLTQPVLGICLGMQLMFESSLEGSADQVNPPAGSSPVRCLAMLPGIIQRLPESPGVRIPHMGWNSLKRRHSHPLVDGLSERDYAYFVHSFAAAESDFTLMACTHGISFSAIVARGNFMGAQFHPERSAAVGAKLLNNFLNLNAEQIAA